MPFMRILCVFATLFIPAVAWSQQEAGQLSENPLDAREASLAEREQALDTREEELTAREAALAPVEEAEAEEEEGSGGTVLANAIARRQHLARQ